MPQIQLFIMAIITVFLPFFSIICKSNLVAYMANNMDLEQTSPKGAVQCLFPW